MPLNSTPIIGLAGGIGSGKSTVAKMLAQAGCVVADSDAAARSSLSDPAIRARILERWGEQALTEAGEIDRSALASIVFNDPEERRALESIIHPWVEQRRVEQFERAVRSEMGGATPALVIDAPLLYEAGLDRTCDAVIFVNAPREARLERVRRTRSWDETELGKREESQWPLDEKRRRADYVVENAGSLDDLGERVRSLLATISQSHRGRAT